MAQTGCYSREETTFADLLAPYQGHHQTCMQGNVQLAKCVPEAKYKAHLFLHLSGGESQAMTQLHIFPSFSGDAHDRGG